MVKCISVISYDSFLKFLDNLIYISKGMCVFLFYFLDPFLTFIGVAIFYFSGIS